MAEIIVAVMGNISSGKTSFTRAMEQKSIGSRLLPLLTTPTGDIRVYYESKKVIEIAEKVFYPALVAKDPYKCFAAELEMLYTRRDWMKEVLKYDGIAIMDRAIYENRFVFAENLYRSGLMLPHHYEAYCTSFEKILNEIPSPDVFVYLAASPETSSKRKMERKNAAENAATYEYLRQTAQLYENLIDVIMPKLIPRWGDKFIQINADKDSTEEELKRFHDAIEIRIEMALIKQGRINKRVIENARVEACI